MLRWRLVSSSVIVAIAVTLVAIDHRLGQSLGYLGVVLAPLVWCVSFLAAGEVRHLFVAKGHQPRAGWTEAGVLLAILISCMPLLWKTYPSDCPVGRVGWVAIGLLAAMGLYLLIEIAKFFRTRQPPVSAEETIELYAFMEAADESKRRGGQPVSIAEVLEKARQSAN